MDQLFPTENKMLEEVKQLKSGNDLGVRVKSRGANGDPGRDDLGVIPQMIHNLQMKCVK